MTYGDGTPPPQDDYGFFAGPVAKRPAGPQIPPPSIPPPPPAPFTDLSRPPIGAYREGMELQPGGRVMVTGPDFDEQTMMYGATRDSYAHMGKTLRPGHYPVGQKLGFFERIGAGIELAKTCWRVLRQEPQLLVVPVLALLASLLVIVPLLLLSGGPADPQADWVLAGIQAFAVGLVVSVIGNLGSAVIISAATTRLEGLRPNLATSWSVALAKLPALAGLGLLTTVERALSNLLRNNLLGRVLAGLIDRSWDFATFLAIPVILFEGAGPLRSVKRSGQLVVSRWGSQLTARALLHLGVFVCALPLLIGMLLLGALFSPAVALAMLWLWVMLVVSVAMALNGILSAAMYRFAITGLVVPGFREADMWRVFARA
jgi:Family of unknown function (DUF6159)